MAIDPKAEVSFSLPTSDPNHPMEILGMEHVEIELLQYFQGSEVEIPVDVNTFSAPSTPGRYHYLAKLTWNGEIKGQANFAFTFAIRK